MNFEAGWTALTPALSPKEREPGMAPSVDASAPLDSSVRSVFVVKTIGCPRPHIAKARRIYLPLLGGEGRGEGGRLPPKPARSHFFLLRSFPWDGPENMGGWKQRPPSPPRLPMNFPQIQGDRRLDFSSVVALNRWGNWCGSREPCVRLRNSWHLPRGWSFLLPSRPQQGSTRGKQDNASGTKKGTPGTQGTLRSTKGPTGPKQVTERGTQGSRHGTKGSTRPYQGCP